MSRHIKGIFFLLVFLFLLQRCAIDTVCKNPELGELFDVKDGIIVKDKLFVLSSPQDVLGWCSAYYTIFHIENDNVLPQQTVGIGGKVAKNIFVIGDFVAVPLIDKNSIYVSDQKVSKEIPLETEGISYSASGTSSFLITSQISKKVVLISDLNSFFASDGVSGVVYYELPDKIGFPFPYGTSVVAVERGENIIHILPDKTFYIDTVNVPKEFQRYVTEFSYNLPITPEIGKVSFYDPIKFVSGTFFIPSKISDDSPGIVVFDEKCIFEENTSCAFFLPAITYTATDKLDYFNVFVFQSEFFPFSITVGQSKGKLPEGEMGEGQAEILQEKENRKFPDVSEFFVFVFRESDKAYTDVWVKHSNSFYFLGRKFLEISNFYQVFDFTIDKQKISIKFVLSVENKIIIDEKKFP